MSQVVAWCMYAVMQMIQNTSIIIAESTFYLCMEGSSFIFSQMQKKPTDFLPDCIRANKSSLLFCYNVYSTEIGMQKENITYVQFKLYIDIANPPILVLL